MLLKCLTHPTLFIFTANSIEGMITFSQKNEWGKARIPMNTRKILNSHSNPEPNNENITILDIKSNLKSHSNQNHSTGKKQAD